MIVEGGQLGVVNKHIVLEKACRSWDNHATIQKKYISQTISCDLSAERMLWCWLTISRSPQVIVVVSMIHRYPSSNLRSNVRVGSSNLITNSLRHQLTWQLEGSDEPWNRGRGGQISWNNKKKSWVCLIYSENSYFRESKRTNHIWGHEMHYTHNWYFGKTSLRDVTDRKGEQASTSPSWK